MAPEPQAPTADSFSFDNVIAEAKALAATDYKPPQSKLPQAYRDLSYDQYRSIWFKPEAAIWAHEPTDFRVDLFHAGFIYQDPVSISLVKNGKATEVQFSTDLFEYGYLDKRPPTEEGMGFAGFRARYPINSPEAYQEFVVFLGASYFRAVGRDQVYGLSARGLAINTAEPSGEEFPAFRAFWLEQPGTGDDTMIVNALLDSQSAAGAYRFAITPGAETVTEVRSELFFRQQTKKVGLAPLTSMFLFNEMNRAGFNDYRRAVHDSDGLQMLTGAGEWVWRPLSNPQELQISAFADHQPNGFGLMQRARAYSDYLDAEAKYQRRPGLWIEPTGEWGDGAIELVEIPTDKEFNDNIVAYWRPNLATEQGSHWAFGYRMRWTSDVLPAPELLHVKANYAGQNLDQNRLLFVIDYATSGDWADMIVEGLEVEASASKGKASNPIIHDSHPSETLRVSFELDPAGADLSELRVLLKRDGKPASETWLYRWTRT